MIRKRIFYERKFVEAVLEDLERNFLRKSQDCLFFCERKHSVNLGSSAEASEMLGFTYKNVAG